MDAVATTNSTSVTSITAATSPISFTTPTVTANEANAITEATPTLIRRPTQSTKTIRIHVNTIGQQHPVIFNYRQLYKREAKRMEEQAQVFAPHTNTDENVKPLNEVESADDAFFKRILANAEKYDVRDDADDVDDDNGSDEEEIMVGSKKGAANDDYDYEDDFIDDSEMLMEEPIEYTAPEFDGFFVYHGPLDGSEESEKKSSTKETAPKRKAPSKPKTSTSSTTTSTINKKSSTSSSSNALTSSKKTSDDHSTDESKKSTSSSTTSNSKPKKQTTLTSSLKVTPSSAATTSSQAKPITTVNKKTASTSLDQPARKKKKVDITTSIVTKSTAKDDSGVFENDKSTSSILSTSSSNGDHATTEKKKKSSTSASAASHELKPLDPEIEELMEKLRRDVVHEDFENKAKFPLALKPTVLEAGLIMLRKTRTIDDNLVYHLMTILPYNRFTLKKFVTTKSGQIRVDELQQEIDELAILLKQTIDKMMPEQQRLFNEKLFLAQAELNIKKADPNYKPPVDEDGNPENELPTPKFKCNDEVRKILYDIIQSEEQSIHISNQIATHKDSEKKNDGLASDNKARKLMYQRLLSCWPEEWMNTYEMSRQYSQYKLKIQGADKKAAAASGISSSQEAPTTVATKKRKRVPTPQSSPSDETRTKNPSIAETGVVAPNSLTFIQKVKEAQPVITIDDDDDDDSGPTVPANNSWKQSNSMKIEALISGPNSSSSQKKPSSS